ncbi:hypothetical protein D0T66_04785 [Dysgonomonas sp. 25]|nr:hypothetical protein [Dysgonomonas sp. 25]
MRVDQCYKLTPKAFTEVRKRAVIISASLILMVLIVVSYILWDTIQSNLLIPGIILPFIIIVFSFSLFNTLKKEKNRQKNFSLILEEDAILYSFDGLNTVCIDKDEIESIVKKTNGDLYIKSSRYPQHFAVSHNIERYNEVVNILSSMHPFSVEKELPFALRYNTTTILGGIIVTLLVLILFYTSKNEIIVVSTAILLSILIVYSSIKTRKWVFMVFFLFIVFIKLYYIFA